MERTRALLWILSTSLIAGCSSHTSSNSSYIPAGAPGMAPEFTARAPNASSAETAVRPNGATRDLVVGVRFRDGETANLLARYPHVKAPHPNAPFVRRPHAAYKSIEIDGQLWPSYAGPIQLTNVTTIPAPSGPIVSASTKFSNDPAGNNQFVLYTMYGIAADGTKNSLGNLAAIVNNSTTTPHTVTATVATTLAFQGEMAMIQAGQFTAHDLETTPNLSTQTANEFTTLSLKPDPTTGLYSDTSLHTLIVDWTPAWRRELKISPNANDTYVTITNDASNTAENTLYLNEGSFLAFNDFYYLRPYGSPCGSSIPAHLPGVKPVVRGTACANYWYGPPNFPPSIYVYGGPLLIAQADYNAPYTASLSKLAGQNPGSQSLGLPALSPADQQFTVNDPQDWAYGNYPQVTRNQLDGSPPISPNAGNWFAAYPQSGWSVSKNHIHVLKWNPWNLPVSDFEYCSFNNQCVAATSTSSVLNIDPPFTDWGNNLSYYNWTGNSGTTIAQDPTGGCTSTRGYHLGLSGNAFSITSHRSTWFTPYMTIVFASPGSSGCTVDPNQMTAQVTAIGTDGHTYTGTATNYNGTGNSFGLCMCSVTRNTPIKSITISGTVPSGTALDFSYIFYNNYWYVSAGKHLGDPALDQRYKAPLPPQPPGAPRYR